MKRLYILLVLISPFLSSAKVIYNDIKDTTIHNWAYQIDFNNDATPDITFFVNYLPSNSPTGNFCKVTSASFFEEDSIVVTSSDTVGKAINEGFDIDNNNNWNASGWMYADEYSIADWKGASDQFIVCKFDISGELHFGWIRVSVAANGSNITVKDYAYNDAGGEGLKTTTNWLSIVDNALDGVTVEQKGNIVWISNKKSDAELKVCLFDLTGKKIKQSRVNQVGEIILSDLPKGVYFLTVEQNGNQITRKISKS